MQNWQERIDPSKESPAKVAIWVESYHTEGHISIVERLARSLQERGVEVLLLGDEGTLGRRPLEGIQTFQLPHRHAEYYGDELQRAIEEFGPQVFVTELIPFGYPDIMNNMVKPLHALKHNMDKHGKPFSIVSWTRDLPDADPTIRYPLERAKIEGFTDVMDALLIQGDKTFIKHPYIEKMTNPFGWKVRNKTHYLGYPVPEMQPLESNGEIVVVAGGGFNEGQKHHFHQVLDAIPHVNETLRNKTWRLFVSKNATQEERAEIEHRASALGNVIVEETGPAFKEAQKRADMLITQGGMTSIECTALGRPTCIVPHTRELGFVASNQYKRGEALAKASGCVSFVDHLSVKDPTFFAKKLDECYASRDRKDIKLPKLNGHEHCADWLAQKCREIQRGASIALS